MNSIEFPRYVSVNDAPHLLIEKTEETWHVLDENLNDKIIQINQSNSSFSVEAYILKRSLLEKIGFTKANGKKGETVWYKDEEDYSSNRFYLIETDNEIFTIMPIDANFKFLHDLQEEYYSKTKKSLVHPFFKKLNQIFLSK